MCIYIYDTDVYCNILILFQPVNVIDSSRILAGKVVIVEQRVVFKLDLPNKKVISVKSKVTKTLGEVLRPILHKYNYKLDIVQVIWHRF